MSRALRTLLVALVATMPTGIALLGTPAAHADAHGVIVTGHGDMGSAYRLELDKHVGTIDVNLVIRTGVKGQQWAVRIVDNGNVQWSGTVASAEKGRVEVDRVIKNLSGPDKVVVKAVNQKTGEVVKAVATI